MPGWPGQADVEALVAEVPDLDPADNPNYEEKIAAAVSEFERRTGWTPFYGDTSDKTRYFDPPRIGGELDLRCGLLTLTSLTIGLTVDSPGTALTENRDFWLEPSNAVEEGRPYSRVVFRSRPAGEPRSVKIVGKFGYALEIPADAWSAVLRRAGALAVRALTGQSGAVIEEKQGDVTYKYAGGQEGGAVLAKGWDDEFENVILRYQRN